MLIFFVLTHMLIKYHKDDKRMLFTTIVLQANENLVYTQYLSLHFTLFSKTLTT
jgi:hypothetical protein